MTIKDKLKVIESKRLEVSKLKSVSGLIRLFIEC